MSQDLEKKAREYLKKRFGVSEEFLESVKFKNRHGDIWLTTGSEKGFEGYDFQTEGIRLIRGKDRGIKPTTYGLQVLEDEIKRNVLELEKNEFLKLLRREEMIPAEFEEEGYVALKFKDRIIGCGFYKDGVVSSRVPKGRGKELAEALD